MEMFVPQNVKCIFFWLICPVFGIFFESAKKKTASNSLPEEWLWVKLKIRISNVLPLGKNNMKKLLVIDDELIIREMIQAILEDEGFVVFMASNGSEGISLCRKNPGIDLVITDIVMPEKEGLETIKEIRAINPSVKIMAISGVGLKDTYLKIARCLGADCILPKPFSADELVQNVFSLLS